MLTTIDQVKEDEGMNGKDKWKMKRCGNKIKCWEELGLGWKEKRDRENKF